MAVLIDGKAASAKVRERLKEQTAALKEKGVVPGLAVILVGEDPASKVYVGSKKRACEEIGYYSEEHLLPENTTTEQLLDLVNQLNSRPEINGILCQLPLPRHIDEWTILNAISPEKDVDAFHPSNVGRIMLGDFDFLPCTPAGVMELLEQYNIDVCGKNCVVIGRSNIVGKPQAMLLLHKNATVTICHSKTKDLAAICRNADVLVAAVGRARFVTSDMVKPGAVVIDVGINRPEGGKLCGDVDFENVKEIASAITPVPGGVGPMTIAMLMQNTLTAALRQAGVEL